MTQYKVDFSTLEWQTPMDGVRFKVFRDGGRQLRLVEYTPDMPPHWCEKGHYGYVLDGRFEISYDDVTHVYGPGDGIFIPSGRAHRHMGKALTPVARVVFVEDVE